VSEEPGTDLRALQDYLDGRLSSEQRAAFETGLERDPELRRELEAARELRDALGEEDPGLSPGFYTRARARFEESGREEQRWSFRLLSWETAGVAAAAALATALFVPWLTQQGVPTDLGAAATERQQTVALDDRKKLDSSFAPDPADERLLVEKEGLEEAPAMETMGRELLDAPEPIAQGPVGFTDTESDLRKNEAAPGKKGAASAETRQARVDRDDSAFHAAAPVEAESAPAAGGFSESAGEAKIVEEGRSKDKSAQAKRGKRAAIMEEAVWPVVVELQPGLVERDQLRSVEQVGEWVELLGGPYGESLEMLGAPATDLRLVLVGARRGLGCETLVVTGDDHTYRIESTRSPKEREADGGCALVLPRDDLGITIVDPR